MVDHAARSFVALGRVPVPRRTTVSRTDDYGSSVLRASGAVLPVSPASCGSSVHGLVAVIRKNRRGALPAAGAARRRPRFVRYLDAPQASKRVHLALSRIPVAFPLAACRAAAAVGQAAAAGVSLVG